MEVEQHDLAGQLVQMAQLSLVVVQRNVDESGSLNLAGIDGAGAVSLADAHVLHALDGDVVQVGTALGVGVVGVPAGGDGGIHLDIVLVGAWIEEQHVAQRLEEREIGIRLVGSREDILLLDLVLVLLNHVEDAVVRLVDGELLVVADKDGTALEVHLLEGELLDFLTVVGTADLVLRGHLRIGSLDGHRLGRVDGDVDNLVADAQSVELGSLRSLAAEREAAVGTELDGVDRCDFADADVLQIEHGVLCLGDVSLYVKFLFAARSHAQQGQCHDNIFLHLLRLLF